MVPRFSLLLIALMAIIGVAFAFDANNGVIDANLALGGAFVDNNSSSANGTYKGSFITSDAPTGSWFSSDGTYSFRVGEFFDQNLPVVTITSPSNGSYQISTIASLAYTAISIGNPINKFWVRLDSEPWIDNGLATSYTFSNLLLGSHTFYVVATDSFDLNSATASSSIIVNYIPGDNATATASDTGTGTSIDAGGGGGSSGSGKTTAPTQISVADVENPTNILKKVDYALVEAITSEGVAVSRAASYMEVKAVGGSSTPVYGFNVNVKNNSGKTYKNVKVREIIPKAVAKNVSMITFKQYPARIIKADPEVEWLVEELAPGKQTSFFYFVKELGDKSIAKDFNSFIAEVPVSTISLEEKKEDTICKGLSCDDDNICTEDVCSQGSCHYNAAYREGINCGENSACRNGECVSNAALVAPKAPRPKQDLGVIGIILGAGALGLLAVVVAIVVLVLVAKRFLKKKR